MKSLVATAPGKLVLCGEYAVLDGAPAISAAVGRRARIDVRTAATPDTDVLVRTIGFQGGEYRYKASEAGLVATAVQAELPLLEIVWRTLGIPAGTRLELDLDTSAFFQSTVKLGLGSSAALSVALIRALATWSGMDDEQVGQVAEAHRRFQGGRGSGVDLATSMDGGLLRFERPGADAAAIRTPVTWPQGLEAAVLFSGIAASTPAKLRRLDSQARLAVSDELAGAAERAAEAWQRGDADEVLDATARLSRTLAAFSEAYDLEVFGGGHAALVELAAEQGLVYKPCGAGGGDIGVVLGSAADRVADFARAATDEGFTTLDIDVGGKADVKGLTIEWTHD